MIRQEREALAAGRQHSALYSSIFLDEEAATKHLKKDPSLVYHFSDLNPEVVGKLSPEEVANAKEGAVKANLNKILVNKQAIEENAKNIDANTSASRSNAWEVEKSKQAIDLNAEDVKANKHAIASHAKGVAANVKSIGALTDDVALFKVQNEQRVTKIEGRTTALEGKS